MKTFLTKPRLRLSYTLFIYLITISFTVYGQNTGSILEGNIADPLGNPIEGANVFLGENFAATTNNEGYFRIEVKPGNHLLKIESLGYARKEISVRTEEGGKTTLGTIILEEKNNEIEEVSIKGSKDTFKENAPSTSLRLQTPLLEVPQNIQVVTKQVLAEQQVFDMLEGATRNVSGVTRVEHWDNYARINMRGSQIAAFRNGMNVQMPWGPLAEDLSMVESIEFVKGPAGFMMATGEPSGFYNIVTKKPTGTERKEATMTLGSFQTYRTTLDLDGNLSKDRKLQYRLNLMGQMRGSHRDYEFNNRLSFAPVLKYNISDQTSITAEYTYQYLQMSAIGSAYSFSAKGYGDLPRNFTTAEPNLPPSDIHEQNVFINLQHQINKNWKATGQLAYIRYNQQGSSLWPSGWPSAIDSIGNMTRGTSIWDALGISKHGQFYLNGNIQTASISHKILTGIDMYHKDYFADWMQSATLTGSEPFNIYNPVYGNVNAAALPVFDRSIGIRSRGVLYNQTNAGIYIQDELGFFADRIRLTIAGRHTTAQTANPYSGVTSDSRFTPRTGLSISLDKSTSVYGVYDQAFVPQAGATFEGRPFQPVTGNNTEAGIKRDWFDGRWNSTIAAYRITKNNVLTADPNNPLFSIQLGQTQVQGLEFDVRGNIAEGLNLILNYAYTDAKISKDTNPEKIGVAVPGSTKHITNGWLSYRFQNTLLKGFGLAMGYQWQIQRSSWFIFDGTESSLPDYFRLDAAVSWQHERLNIGLNINNLLNEYLFSGSPYGAMYYWQTEAGRNFRLTMGYKF